MPGYFDYAVEILREINIISVCVRLFLAAIVGGIVGANRNRHGRAAGMRTHILVSLGSAITALVGVYSVGVLQFSGDPMRVAAQVISGIGFLGAGTILTRNHSQITGLTTAAGLWATASMGVALGVGFYLAAIVGFAAMMLTIALLPHFEYRKKGVESKLLYIEISDLTKMNELVDYLGSQVYNMQIVESHTGVSGHVGLECFIAQAKNKDQLMTSLRDFSYVDIAVLVG